MKPACLPLVLILASSYFSPAWATAYDFNVLYAGNNQAILAPGSDHPVGTSLVAGDSFEYRLIAQGPGEWTVLTDSEIFPFFALGVEESAERTADWTLTLLNNGAAVYSATTSADWNAFIHLGTNDLALPTGLVFDEIDLNYTLLSSTSTYSTPDILLPYPGMGPEYNADGALAYAVPEPSSYAMMLAGLAAVTWAGRRQSAPGS